ncbi:hypothetical protein [Mycobacterium botniense]|uniref:Uncharacterized protein n=1 Tax=Mycobacterium botniense TaxID=84962 RepID=A0A7I9XRQ9_9MYCO|nr:hypothetical protein [Mycobacterium botniense]GFG72681.1 hypothetical protein MBOT_00460 [Mycobacterium botniense]
MFAAISAGWDTNGYPAAQLTFYHGMPWRLFKDVFGQLASLIRRGVLYTDYLDEIKVIDNAEIRCRIDVRWRRAPRRSAYDIDPTQNS